LRTPVSLIRGYLSLFEEGDLGELNERGHQAVSVMRAQARELNLLLGRMLEVARLEEGVDISGKRLDLHRVAGEAVAAVRGQAGAAHRFTLVAPDQTVPVVADPRQLRTALDNLLNNSVKYSPGGGEHVYAAGSPGGDRWDGLRRSLSPPRRRASPGSPRQQSPMVRPGWESPPWQTELDRPPVVSHWWLTRSAVRTERSTTIG